MNQFLLKKDGKELQAFPHIVELGLKKNHTIQLHSFKKSGADFLRLFYVFDGKFEWIIEGESVLLYPGDLAVILPGQMVGGEKDFLDIGTIGWLHLQTMMRTNKATSLGDWGGLSAHESGRIAQSLLSNQSPVFSKLKEAGSILQLLWKEATSEELGYLTRVNGLLDELLILIARRLTRQSDSRKDFPQTFLKLEQRLREDLAHQWTVEEMASLVGLGTTAFSEKVKSFTGFSPLHYLINLRISEAIKLLKKKDVNVTGIALDVGFYSSQHFATTFKKLTGYTPREFRKENTTDT